MTLLDKADIREQTAHIGHTEVGTVRSRRFWGGPPTKVEPKRAKVTYTFLGLPNDTFPVGECVYFMYSAGRIKIGFSNGLDQRRNSLSASGPFPPVIVLIMRGSVKDEKKLHQRFAKSRLHGEWFTLSGPIQSFLSYRLCDIGRATLDKAQAKFRDFCEGFLDGYKPPKRKPRPSCDHGKPYGNHCHFCERNAAEKRLELLRSHLANPTPENTAAVEAECFSPRSPFAGGVR